MVDWRAPLPIVIARKSGVAPLIRRVPKIIATDLVLVRSSEQRSIALAVGISDPFIVRGTGV
jgi:hypothetical protein